MSPARIGSEALPSVRPPVGRTRRAGGIPRAEHLPRIARRLASGGLRGVPSPRLGRPVQYGPPLGTDGSDAVEAIECFADHLIRVQVLVLGEPAAKEHPRLPRLQLG